MTFAPSMAATALQTAPGRLLGRVEVWLDANRDQLPLWIPVALGAGIGLWFALPGREMWVAVLLCGAALVLAGLGIGLAWRSGRAMIWAGVLLALGCGWIWIKAEMAAGAPLARAATVALSGRVERVELRPEEDKVRLTLATDPQPGLPARVRVSGVATDMPKDIASSDRVALRARLMPPAEPLVPGAYDFARIAWFQGLGATGRTLGAVRRIDAAPSQPGLRERLTAHVRGRLSGSAGGIAAAFATGDRGGIAPEDEEAMRASGLTHLLSISGLHITSVVAATMFATLRLLALSPVLALRLPLLLIAAGAGAAAGVGYTLLTGAEVPTIRSCIAALLVLAGLALGREALTLRLVATGAVVVLLFWPEALVGPSFQLSFAAITAIVALHETQWMRRITHRREEALPIKAGRVVLTLLLTGLAVEIALAPIALFHFHKSGLYGALANIVAIPLTTFIIMPAEALALLLDTVGLGAPAWWMAGQGIDALLGLARVVAAAPGAVAALPRMPVIAFVLMLGGGLWLLLWSTRARLIGLAPFTVGATLATAAPAPDVLITGDGRHLAVRGEAGELALLRERTGDYVRDLLSEQAGELAEPLPIDAWPGARCSRDLCVIDIKRENRVWRVAATRSAYRIDWRSLVATCAGTDIMVSDRWLPRGCVPRWLKADPALLGRTGGLSVDLAGERVDTVRTPGDDHPWTRTGSSIAPQ